jgi:hypothetical protein
VNIAQGLAYITFAYDAARSIDLVAAERRIHETSQRQTIRQKRRAPSYFEFQPPPLRVSRETEPLGVGRFFTRPGIDLLLYDFGAVAVIYTIPLERSFSGLLDLSEELYSNALLLSDSRQRVEQALKVIGDAATHANLADMVEDYVLFHIESLEEPFEGTAFCRQHRQQIAQILRAERRPLSEQEITDALAATLSYSAEDVTIIDWNAALLVDRDGDDVRSVLEFANVELVEVRYLDQRLDQALDKSYETLVKHQSGLLRRIGYYGADLRSLAELQVDNATLFEGVNNAVKLLGDQYLSRAYQMASRRFHLDDWDASILRKLHTLESIYEKLSDQTTTRRMEILEWVIIFLIAFSIVLELIHLGFA